MFENRIKTLEAIEDKNWQDILDNNYLEYLDCQESYRNKNFTEAAEKLKQLLPKYFEGIHLVNQKHIQEKLIPDFNKNPYNVGIFLVGHSIMPVILSISEIKPEAIIFVTTDDTEALAGEIKEGINIINSKYYDDIKTNIREEKLGKISDPAEIFKLINALIIQNKEKRIAIDITGGKKTMVAGAFMASAHSKPACDIFYIDFEEYDPEKREPCYGTEFLARLPNPSEIFSIADWERIESLFDRYQFKQVKEEIKRIKKNISKYKTYFDAKIQDKIISIENYAEGYEYWDDYRYDESIKYLKNETALKILNDIVGNYTTSFNSYKRSMPFPDANNKAIEDNKTAIYNKNEWLLYYLLDRLENARRRKSQGQIQGAFLRFITLTEFVLSLWAKMNLNHSVIQSLSDKKGSIIFNCLLNYLNNNSSEQIIQRIDFIRLRELKNIRNDHILIHSIRVIDEATVNDSEAIAERVILNLFGIKGIEKNDIETAKERLKFKRFKGVISQIA